jgi:tRNA wybutosine-synthesizing protein 3
MVTTFDKYKQDVLGKKDKSSIGEHDEKIRDLCNKINSMPDYYTTSSCSGRITLVKDNIKKIHGLFLWRIHEKTSFEEVKEELYKCKENKELIYFKQEPCLLVVSCRNSESQKKLFEIARNNGWKKSGIISADKRFIAELMSTENISLPVMDEGEILIDDDYLKFLVNEANRKLELTWKKVERLKELI